MREPLDPTTEQPGEGGGGFSDKKGTFTYAFVSAVAASAVFVVTAGIGIPTIGAILLALAGGFALFRFLRKNKPEFPWS